MEINLKEFIGEKRPEAREDAIALVEKYIAHKMKSFVEPVREGTAKGDKIGFSEKKLKAAYFMPLHPNCFSLDDIAELVKTTGPTVRVWRTNDDFKEKVKQAEEDIAQIIFRAIDRLILRRNVDLFGSTDRNEDIEAFHTNQLIDSLGVRKEDMTTIPVNTPEIGDKIFILKSDLEIYKQEVESLNIKTNKEILKSLGNGKPVIIIDDSFAKLKGTENINDPFVTIEALLQTIPFFSVKVFEYLLEKLFAQMKQEIPGYAHVFILIEKSLSVWDEETHRKWKKSPLIQNLHRRLIEGYINDLTTPHHRERMSDEELKIIGGKLKALIFENYEK